MKQFEYKVYTPFLASDEKLNKLGAEGWELVAVDGGTFYFKREYKE